MDVVCVNLSRADASLLLRLVEGEIGGCACSDASSSRCDGCEALDAIRSDLRLLLIRRRARVTRASEYLSSRRAVESDGWGGLARVDPFPQC